MTEELERIKKKIIPLLKKSDVTRSAFFGSVARGETKPESDIDILVEFSKGKSFFDFVELKDNLEKALARDVDLVTYKSVNPLLKDLIFQDEVKIL